MHWSRLWDFEVGYRKIGMVIDAEIFDVSILYLSCGLTIVMQICNLTLSGIDELIQITTG